MKYKEFPYPSKLKMITVYGREGCKYCEKMKSFLKKFYFYNSNKYEYHDIFQIIDDKQAKDVTDFKKKMKIFMGDFSTVPIVFVRGNFIGGYDNFCKLIYDFATNEEKNSIIKILGSVEEFELLKKIKNKLKNKNNKCKAIINAKK